MVEEMKIMATSFKKFHAGTATLSAANPAAAHLWSMPLPETPGHSGARLGQSLVGSLLLFPGSGLVHWDDPEGWDGEGGARGGSGCGPHGHPWLIHVNALEKEMATHSSIPA